MAKYKLIEEGVLDTETGACIPESTSNTDWLEYLKWLDEGNTPDPQYTQAELDDQIVRDRISDLLSSLSADYYNLVALVWQMYDAGIKKNLWKTDDFDPKRVLVADDFKLKVDELDTLINN